VDRAPKYYNSSETPLFSKSELLYGADRARTVAGKVGYLAIVEGYTDVMMAHQHGIANVVATMGTALNAKHVQKLKALAPRVVLVFDADAGGDTGVDRAMEVFVSHDVDLRVATLPEGLDPCDLLTARGPEPFRQALESAVEVLEFKLQRVWAAEANSGLDGQRRAVEQVLTILAAAPDERSVKLQLMVNRIAHRLNLKEETVWSRLREIRSARRAAPERAGEKAPADVGVQASAGFAPPEGETPAPRSGPAPRHEVQLLEVLLANANLVARAKGEVKLEEMEHPGLRLLLECLYRLETEGRQADLDHLQGRVDNEKLMETARQLQDRGLQYLDGAAELEGVLKRFIGRRIAPLKQALRARLEAGDTEAVAELQRQLRDLSQRMTNDS
jgi:DNA primase